MQTEPLRRRRRKVPTATRGPAKALKGTHVNTTRDVLEFRALQAFRMVVGSARNYDAEVRRITGISGSQLWALSEISDTAGISVNALSAKLAVHQTTASNLVNALVEHGLIRRTRDNADQRVVRLFATADGKRLLLRAPRPYSGLLIEALRSLQPANLTCLVSSLSAMLNAMHRPETSSAGQTLLGE